MVKVTFIHSYGVKAFEKKSVGGTQLQLYYISRELAKEEDFDISFITRTKTSRKMEGVQLVPGMDKINGWSSRLKAGLKLILRMREEDADIYFSSSDNMIPGLVGLYCKLSGKKHIHRTVHKRECDRTLKEKNWVKGVINSIGLRLADLVFVQTDSHGDLLSEWTDSRFEVLANSFPITDSNHQLGNKILWVGRRVRWKRPELFIELAERFESEEFVMISPCTGDEEEYYNMIEQKASEISNLNLIERVPREEIQEYFKDAKIFVNTSKKEGFPNTFIEAGMHHTPILSLKVDPDNFIQSNSCGFSCENDFEEMCLNLDNLLENKAEIKEKGENCRTYVEENHDISKNIVKIKDEILRLIQ